MYQLLRKEKTCLEGAFFLFSEKSIQALCRSFELGSIYWRLFYWTLLTLSPDFEGLRQRQISNPNTTSHPNSLNLTL